MSEKGDNESFDKVEKQAFRSALVIISVLFMLMIVGLIVLETVSPVLFGHRPKNHVIEKTETTPDPNRIENGIHVRTGLIDGEGLMTVINNCTVCHSAKIITQNRMNEDSWNSTIKWMQETQNLWDLGDKQEVIVNYLVSNYPVKRKGRRENLSDIKWYKLKN